MVIFSIPCFEINELGESGICLSKSIRYMFINVFPAVIGTEKIRVL